MQAAAEAEQLHNSGRNLALAVAVAAAHQKQVAAEPSPGRWAVWSVAHNPSLVAEQMELEEQAVLLELVEQQELLELVIVSVQAAEVQEPARVARQALLVAQVRGEQEPGALPLARLQVAEVLERVPELVARQALLVARAVQQLLAAEEQEQARLLEQQVLPVAQVVREPQVREEQPLARLLEQLAREKQPLARLRARLLERLVVALLAHGAADFPPEQ